jgi:hypothetical protein
VEAIASYRLPKLKLYFMIGLPEETTEDVQAIVTLVEDMAGALRARGRRPGITVKLSPFVPKAQTPFEGDAMLSPRDLSERAAIIKRGLRRSGVVVKADSPQWAAVEGILARGDRRLAAALNAVAGSSWSDWQAALSAAGLTADHYLSGRSGRGRRPWATVHSGVTKEYLEAEAQRARQAITTAKCPPASACCKRCGVCVPIASRDENRAAPDSQVGAGIEAARSCS